MCGIVGFVNKGGAVPDREILERMNAAIIHRGPDDDGFYVGEGAALAMRRLSIIDIAGGKQPIHNADRTKWIVFNGEIYNFQELRKEFEDDGTQLFTNSDTEIVLRLYERYGAAFLEKLRGMFAFAIWDENKRELFAARDRVGKKPFLYSQLSDGGIVFGSEFQAVLKHPMISREIDPKAIDAYMSYMCVPAPMTAFRHIRKLEPGHWLKWKDGEVITERYWLPDFSRKINISEEEAIEETIRILGEATRLRMISEVPLGAFLSGGVDSSAVVALMARESSEPVKTFSIGFEEEDFSELKYAKQVANHVGAEYNEFIVRPNAVEILPTLVEHYGEPYADSSAIPTYYVSKETRKHVTVALNGDGGDESFAGYERYVAMELAENYQRIPAILRKSIIEGALGLFPTSDTRKSRIRDVQRFAAAADLPTVERYFRWMSAFDTDTRGGLYSADLRSSLNRSVPRSVLEPWFAGHEGRGMLDTTLLADQMTYLPNDLLVKVDIASMANSLEARSPFLDHKLIEFAASLPPRLKMGRFTTKSLLKKAAARLVPRDVIYRRKMGFGVPIGRWLRGDMREFMNSVLLSERSLKRGLFNAAAIKKLVKEHTEGERDHTSKLWALLMLELWFCRFIDRY